MSKMSNPCVEIYDMLARGETPQYIARVLDIPVAWVYEAMEMDEDLDSYSPYQTVNS